METENTEVTPEQEKSYRHNVGLDYSSLKKAGTVKIVFMDSKMVEAKFLKMDSYNVKVETKKGILLIPKQSIKYYILHEHKQQEGEK